MDPATIKLALERHESQIQELINQKDALQAQTTYLFNQSSAEKRRLRQVLPMLETFTGNNSK